MRPVGGGGMRSCLKCKRKYFTNHGISIPVVAPSLFPYPDSVFVVTLPPLPSPPSIALYPGPVDLLPRTFPPLSSPCHGIAIYFWLDSTPTSTQKLVHTQEGSDATTPAGATLVGGWESYPWFGLSARSALKKGQGMFVRWFIGRYLTA